jgi:hypothetical protein
MLPDIKTSPPEAQKAHTMTQFRKRISLFTAGLWIFAVSLIYFERKELFGIQQPTFNTTTEERFDEAYLERQLQPAKHKAVNRVKSKDGIYPASNPIVFEKYRKASTNSSRAEPRTGRFAYAFIVGGCKPESPSYRPYIYNIAISTYIQRKRGSTADVILMVQMAYASSHETLPPDDKALLERLGIQVQYIPKTKDESFYRLMLDKFRILRLTQYDRVLFMDSDALARTNLDYLFMLSYEGVLKENFILAGPTEPANGGFFLLQPRPGGWERLLDIVRVAEERGRQSLPYPHWDTTLGWGQAIPALQPYETLVSESRTKATRWGFHGAIADQGLLYHWVKYERQSVSILINRVVQNWGTDADGQPKMKEKVIFQTLLDRVPESSHHPNFCWRTFVRVRACVPPHSDYVHFTGNRKPWKALGRTQNATTVSKTRYRRSVTTAGPREYRGQQEYRAFWYDTLRTMATELHWTMPAVESISWNRTHRAPLGKFPLHTDAATTQYAASVWSERS